MIGHRLSQSHPDRDAGSDCMVCAANAQLGTTNQSDPVDTIHLCERQRRGLRGRGNIHRKLRLSRRLKNAAIEHGPQREKKAHRVVRDSGIFPDRSFVILQRLMRTVRWIMAVIRTATERCIRQLRLLRLTATMRGWCRLRIMHIQHPRRTTAERIKDSTHHQELNDLRNHSEIK